MPGPTVSASVRARRIHTSRCSSTPRGAHDDALDVEPCALENVDQQLLGPVAEPASWEVVVAVAGMVVVTGEEHETDQAADLHAAVQVPQRHRHLLAAAGARSSGPPRRRRASGGRTAGHAGLPGPWVPRAGGAGTRSSMAGVASSAIVPSGSDGRCQPGPQPRSTTGRVTPVAATSRVNSSARSVRNVRRSLHSSARAWYTATVSAWGSRPPVVSAAPFNGRRDGPAAVASTPTTARGPRPGRVS